jgi:hypothetical protein
MITNKQLEDLVSITMKDMPLPKVVDLMCCPNDEGCDSMLTFIKTHYTKEEIEAGITELLERVEFMNQLFSGVKNEPKKLP